MLRTDLAAKLQSDTLGDGFIRPSWATYSFANVADTIRSLFGGAPRRPLPADVFDGVATDVENVVLVVVDGLGWNHLQRVRGQHPVLGRLASRARVTPLTSLYPSETAAAITTLHTGTQPCEHGVLGWNAYIPALGGSVQTLPFADMDDKPLETTLETADPAALVDAPPIYPHLSNAAVVASENVAETTYSHQVTTGSRAVPFRNTQDGFYRVRSELERTSGPTFIQLYISDVDAASHADGVAHPATDAQLAGVCAGLQRELLDRLDRETAAQTLLLVTADHGAVDSTPETTVALEELALDPHLARDDGGHPIPAQGGPRNLQFFAQREARKPLAAELREGLEPLNPLVLTREKILATNLFGDRPPSERFLRRCPDVLAIPGKGLAWYEEKLECVGMHGGCHPDEMLVPFAAARLDRL